MYHVQVMHYPAKTVFTLPLIASNTIFLVHRGIQIPEYLERRPTPEQEQLPLCVQNIVQFPTEKITG